jgi:hypothetical protein
MWSALATVAAYAIAGTTPTALPTADALAFAWNAPAECPSAAEVRADVERHLGMPLHELALAKWSVSGEVTRGSDGGWTSALVIETPDGRNERTLHDPADCAAVSDAAALLIALALDPEAVASTGDAEATDVGATESKREPEPQPEIVAADAPVGGVEPRPPEPPSPSRPLPLYFVVGAAGGLDWGTLRGVSPIGKATFAWQLPRMRAGVNAVFGITPGFRIPSVNRDISLWMWTVGADAGPVFRVGRWEFPLMAGVEAGQITIRPRVLLDPARRQVTWAALLLTPGVAWSPRNWFALTAQVGAMISFVRPEFEIQGIGVIHAPLPAGIRATLGAEFRIQLPVTER